MVMGIAPRHFAAALAEAHAVNVRQMMGSSSDGGFDSSDDDSDDNDAGVILSTPAIAGMIICLVIFVILVLMMICYRRRIAENARAWYGNRPPPPPGGAREYGLGPGSNYYARGAAGGNTTNGPHTGGYGYQYKPPEEIPTVRPHVDGEEPPPPYSKHDQNARSNAQELQAWDEIEIGGPSTMRPAYQPVGTNATAGQNRGRN